MKKLKVIVLLMMAGSCYGQDPQFSQFFSSPLNINPALTAHINADWRMISNLRDQWIGPASPYVTGTVSYDRKLFQNKIPNVDNTDDNVFGIGTMLMYDHSMSGIQKSTYASLDLSYNIKIAEGFGKHRLGLGFGTIYGRRYIDFDCLYTQDQWVGFNGFNRNLPSGEALTQMKPYFSVSTGLVYTFSTEKSNLDMGVAAFHVNKPRQTFQQDPNQIYRCVKWRMQILRLTSKTTLCSIRMRFISFKRRRIIFLQEGRLDFLLETSKGQCSI